MNWNAPAVSICASMSTSRPPQKEEKSVFPDEQINVTPSRSAIVLSGHVSDETVAKRAEAIAGAYSKNVVNVLTFGPTGAQEVLLQVKFAEVDRTARRKLASMSFNGRGQHHRNDIDRPVGALARPHHRRDGRPDRALSDKGDDQRCAESVLFRPDIHLGTVIKALQQQNLLQILAEPNLIAVNGKEASFLAAANSLSRSSSRGKASRR